MEAQVKRFLLVTAIALLSINAQAGTTWYKKVAEAQAEAKKKNTLIFVDLFAQWCTWCHKAEQEVFPSEKFQQATDDMVLLRLDTEDRGEGTLFAQNFQISSLPTFLILNGDLELAGMIRGYAPAAEFSAQVVRQRKMFEQFQRDVNVDVSKDYVRALDVATYMVGLKYYAKAEPRLKQIIDAKKAPLAIRQGAVFQMALVDDALGKKDEALKQLAALDKMKPPPALAEKVSFARSQLYIFQQKYKNALTELRKFREQYPNSDQMDWVNRVIPQLESAVSKAQ